MPEKRNCPRCGEALPEGASAGGLCPRCLLKMGLDGEDPACPKCGTSLDGTTSRCSSCGEDVLSLLSTQSSSDSTDRPTEEPAKRIGEFQIIRVVGRGGMGTVYEAYQESMQRRVALKVLDTGLFPSDKEIARFEQEAWIGGRLNHPHIVKVFAQGAEGNTRYIAMEFVEGTSFHDEIEKARKVQREGSASSWKREHIRKMVELFVGIADALHYVHEQGIVHRDIKPLNLLLPAGGERLLLTDFGLARDLDATRMTRRGDFLGTIRYMSPEQLLASRVKVDHRSDIYSLGVSLYEAVTLDLPYGGDSEEAYISAVSTKEPVPARKRNKAIPRDLETVLMKCLERDPDRRYKSVGELKGDLHRYLEGRPVEAKRPGLFRKGKSLARRQKWLLAGALLAAVVGVIVTWSIMSYRQEQRDLDRIRWTLRESIRTGEAAGTLQEAWPELSQVLEEEIRADPDGDLAKLALRSSCYVRFEIPRFGLVSDPPGWLLSFQRFMFPPGARTDDSASHYCGVELQGSLDDGSWKLLGARVLAVGQRGIVGGIGLIDPEDYFSRSELTSGPHQVRLRTRFRFSGLLESPPDEVCENLRPLEECWPSVAGWEMLEPEFQEIDPFSISLYEEYPPEFPRPIIDPDVDEEIRKTLVIEKVRAVRVDLPEGNGAGFEFDWGFPQRCTPKDPTLRESLFVGLDIFGEFPDAPPVPIAYEAELSLEGDSEPIARFFMALSDSFREFFEPGTEPMGMFGVNLGMMYFWNDTVPYGVFAPIHSLASPDDGVYSGTLRLTPSKQAARLTERFTTYFGGELIFPITVEIDTLPATWAEVEDCEDGDLPP